MYDELLFLLECTDFGILVGLIILLICFTIMFIRSG